MGKVVKATVVNEKEEANMETDKVNNETTAAPAANNGSVVIVTEKKSLGDKFADAIWRKRGIGGKIAVATITAAAGVGIGIGIKVLLAAIFGHEAAEAIDLNPEDFTVDE